jgi:hypothetical protein
MIQLSLSSEGLSVQAGTMGMEFGHDGHKSQAIWQEAGQELLSAGLAKTHGSDELFELTGSGYRAVEKMPPGTVNQILAIK